MKNFVMCPNCGNENPPYKLTCINCKTHLREKIYNLDLWKMIGMLIESPVKAFKLIILSEHKNFIFLILALFSIKFFIDARILSVMYTGNGALKINLVPALLITFGAAILIVFVFSLIFSVINLSLGLKTRVKDDYAIFSYSQIPYSAGLIILFPIEIIIFGEFLFSDNPSPFIIKPDLAYTLAGFEGLIILWGIYLSISGVYSASKNFLYSFLTGIIFYLYLYGFLYSLSKILFT